VKAIQKTKDKYSSNNPKDLLNDMIKCVTQITKDVEHHQPERILEHAGDLGISCVYSYLVLKPEDCKRLCVDNFMEFLLWTQSQLKLHS